MKRAEPSWVVVKFGPEVPAGILRLACLLCGDMHDTPLPMSVTDLVAANEDFTRRHQRCRSSK